MYKQDSANPDRFQVLYDAGYAIGTNGETFVRVVVNKAGGIHTAFPVKGIG